MKLIQGGAMLKATGGLIDVIRQDVDYAHIAGNSTVHRMMAVTTQATGADQVWAGLEGLRGFSGGGIGVAGMQPPLSPAPAPAVPHPRFPAFSLAPDTSEACSPSVWSDRRR